jgi:hypothetical protein
VNAQAQNVNLADTITHPLREDNGSVNLRKFDEASLDSYRSNKDFQYDREVKKVNLNWLGEILEWLYKHIFRNMSGQQGSSSTLILFRVICIALVIFAVFRLVKADWFSIFQRRSRKSEDVGFEDITENIHELDFNKLISEAIQLQNYKRATRLLYLKTLKTLSDRNVIDWQLHKTNYDYIRELGKYSYQHDFQRLTFLFEYICYGDFHIGSNQFHEVQDEFRAFEQKTTKAIFA